MLKIVLFRILMSLAAWHGDGETQEAREARMQVFADAIDKATEHAACEGSWKNDTTCKVIWRDRISGAARLVYLADAETNLSKHVHEGRCGEHADSPKGECDSGRARSPWQLHDNANFTREEWAAVNTVEGTEIAAYKALAALAFGRHSCGTDAGMFSQYGHGSLGACDVARTKQPKKWQKRAAGAQALEARIRKELTEVEKTP